MNVSADKIFVNRFIKGDARAFDDFFRDYFVHLFRFAHTRLHGDENAAEDVVQAALCKAVGKLNTYPVVAGMGEFYQAQAVEVLPVENGVVHYSSAQQGVHTIVGIQRSLSPGLSWRLDIYRKDYTKV